jgi:hypothetical protein
MLAVAAVEMTAVIHLEAQVALEGLAVAALEILEHLVAQMAQMELQILAAAAAAVDLILVHQPLMVAQAVRVLLF